MEEQAEEHEVLEAIYGEDERFKEISSTSYQYKYGDEGARTSFLLEISWPEDYPGILPKFNLNAFYNNHLSAEIKSSILKEIVKESGEYIGVVQTYSMIEWVRENFERLASEYIPEGNDVKSADTTEGKVSEEATEGESKSKTKKEHLTKSQKRKEWDRKDNKGEMVRGTGWVDVVKHLSQTGSQQPDD